VGAGLARLVDTPARYGQNADLTLVDAREETIAALVADERVAALDVVTTADVLLADGTAVAAVAREHRLGALPVETVTGRAPARAGEAALGPRLAARLGLVPGDVLDVRARGGGTVRLAVTGVVVVGSEQGGALGETLVVAPDQLPVIAPAEPVVSAAVAARPGRAGAVFDSLSHDHEVFLAETPDEIRTLRDLLLLPELLAAALALVGAAGLVHAVVTATRRHAASLAVLAALGATPRQVHRTVAVLAVATALPALLIGMPLGVAVGRVLWWEIATGTGVGGDLALPGALLAGLGPAVLLVALLAAGGPALRAARTPPAALLRGE
jgi:putative ABC transport system permease protein